MPLTNTQFATLKAAIIADATAAPIRTAGDTAALLAWCNAATTTSAWRQAVSSASLFDSLTISTFDNLSAGRRDALRLMMDQGTVDATKINIRNGLADIFTVGGLYTDAAQLPKMLNGACVEFATKAQALIGGATPAAVGGVTALKRNYVDLVSQAECDRLVN